MADEKRADNVQTIPAEPNDFADDGDSILDKLLDENNEDPIELTAEDGTRQRFEQIAIVAYEDEAYAILRPMDLKKNQVAVFHIDEYDEDSLDLIVDEALALKVIEVYQKGE